MSAAGARCWGDGDPLLADYHDLEWGRPVHGERGLFEKVCLEGFQAGLSWRVVLARRAQLRQAFSDFDPDVLAALPETAVDGLLGAEGMLRNRAKVRAVLTNARACVALRDTGAGLPELVWSHRPRGRRAAPRSRTDVATVTPESTALASALRAAGFVFVGPTTSYALMQADGLVNDHLLTCPVRREVDAEQRAAR